MGLCRKPQVRAKLKAKERATAASVLYPGWHGTGGGDRANP